MATDHDNPPVEKVSVLLATRDRADVLASTLGRFRDLDTAGLDWEVVVVDSASRDATPEALRRAVGGLPLRTVRVEEPGKNRALNRALPLLSGDLVVFTDDDVIPARGWLREMAAAADRWPGHAIFGGRIDLALPPGTPEWMLELPGLAVGLARFSPRADEGITPWPPGGPNWAVRSAVLEGRAFDETIGPDGTTGYAMGSETELIVRLQGEGHEVVYAPRAALLHVVRPEQLTDEALCRRAYRFGRGRARLEGSEDVAMMWGAPRWAWRAYGTETLTAILSRPFDRRASLRARMQAHFHRGQIDEHRRADR